MGALTAGAVARRISGDAAEASALAREALEKTEGAGSDVLAWYLPDLARVSTAVGDLATVERLTGSVPQSLPRYGLAVGSAQATLAEARGDLAHARDLFSRAADGWTRFGHALERGEAMFGESRCLLGMGSPDEAVRRLADAREVFVALRAEPLLTEAGRWIETEASQASRA